MQELTEDFCNLATQDRADKENGHSTINDMQVQLSAMRALIQ
jgi:hypothetical protein